MDVLFKKSFSNRVTKGLEDCINVAHVAYMITVSQKSDRILVFLHTPSSKLTYNVPLYIINIIEENIE